MPVQESPGPGEVSAAAVNEALPVAATHVDASEGPLVSQRWMSGPQSSHSLRALLMIEAWLVTH